MVENFVKFFICVSKAVLCIIDVLSNHWEPQDPVGSMVINLYSAPVRYDQFGSCDIKSLDEPGR